MAPVPFLITQEMEAILARRQVGIFQRDIDKRIKALKKAADRGVGIEAIPLDLHLLEMDYAIRVVGPGLVAWKEAD